MRSVDPFLVALAGIPAALVGYLIASRRMSGRIKTTEADKLWSEAARLRKWSEDRVDWQDQKIQRLEERLDAMSRERLNLEQQVTTLQRENLEHEHTIRDLKSQLDKALARVAELERKSSGS